MELPAEIPSDWIDSGPKRAGVRPAHIDRLKKDAEKGGPLVWCEHFVEVSLEEGKIGKLRFLSRSFFLSAGPILDEKNPDTPRGSVFIVDVKDKAAAEVGWREFGRGPRDTEVELSPRTKVNHLTNRASPFSISR